MRRLAALVLVALAACGVPTDDTPRVIADDNVPFELLDPGPAPSGDPRASEPAASTVVIHLIAADRLQPVERNVDEPITIDARLRLLQRGPTESEVADGVRSAVDLVTRDLTGQRQGSTIVVSVSEEFVAIEGPDHVLAVAQVVFTVTEIDGVDSVVFEREGSHLEVPTGDGTLTSRPVTRSDFATLAA